MNDFTLHPPAGAKHKKKIVGRGKGSGLGGTAGKGNKGQQARSGGKTYPGFEGGQMPLYRRIAQRGFNNKKFSHPFQIVNLGDVDKRFEAGEIVDSVSLSRKGLVNKAELPVKILGNGTVTKVLTFVTDAVSASAKSKIEAAGGKVELT